MLTDTTCKNAKAKDKPYKIADEKGMFLLVNPNGSKYFRFKYRIDGKEKLLALGVYPETSLKQARDKRDEARSQLTDGIDPSLKRKAEKTGSLENTFSAIAKEFIENNRQRWSESHFNHVQQRLERDVYPWIGNRPVKELTAQEVLATLKRIVDRGALESAARAKQLIGQALRYGIATGRAERDVTADLRGDVTVASKRTLCRDY